MIDWKMPTEEQAQAARRYGLDPARLIAAQVGSDTAMLKDMIKRTEYLMRGSEITLEIAQDGTTRRP